MNKIDIEIETVQISNYLSIIKQILAQHEELSINKTIVFSYILKKDKYQMSMIYSGANTKNLVCKALSLLSGDFHTYCENIPYILKAIHLLLKKNEITNNMNLLSLSESHVQISNVYFEENMFLKNAIDASKNMSDRQFMKEVIANV